MLQTSLPRNSNRKNNRLSMLSGGMKASSSRSTRVIEELQENWDNIQKEVESTKSQLESLKNTKDRNEKENDDYVESNKKLRADIHEIMQVLESKQELLDSTKKASLETENKVKQLKNEVMIARKELDDLKRREHSIEKERHTIIAQKKRTAEQSEALKKQVAHSKAEMEKQTEALDIELTQLNNKIVEIKSINVGAIVQKALDEQDKQRKVDLKELDVLKSRMESNNQRFIAQVREHIQCLMDEARHSASEDWKGKVTDCNDDVNGLVARIKAGANVYL